ncbi:hypothetical protein SH1V18_22620 [Vallitalea longa]|uniref:Lipoprotein n=1 Tax=Vallitalea longa TaxID=2936439 RepID=A0A9W5Y9J1_9FIRM|nr:hypothetical protein [Vallitalea longa]GKX29782.1 hypothetical protein SH1V18_22620 [Vallitalea longa]
MKKLKEIISICIVLIVLTGCSTKAYIDYNNAIVKTESEKTGKQSIEIKLDIDFDTQGLSLEEVKLLNYYSEMMYQLTNKYDMDDDKIATDVYMNLGGIGLDSNYYKDGDEQYVKIPVLNKYINLTKEKFINNEYNDIFKAVSDKWLDLLKEENVLKGNDTIVDTKEGQVKAKEVTINIQDEQLNELSKVIIDTIIDSGILEDFIYVIDDEGNTDKIRKEDVVEVINEAFSNLIFDSFEAKAYIDFDGYLIEENIEMNMRISEKMNGKPIAIKLSFNNKYWDIGKKQVIDIPDIAEDDIIEMKELKDLDSILGL